MIQREIDKLDDIDRNVLMWSARNQAQFVSPLLNMYERDYKRKGTPLNGLKIMAELNRIIWNNKGK